MSQAMNNARTEAVARKVAEVLGWGGLDHFPGWFVCPDPLSWENQCYSVHGMTSDLNVAGRVRDAMWAKYKEWESDDPTAEMLRFSEELAMFDCRAWDHPAPTIDALLVAAGLLEPDKEGAATDA